MKQGSQPDRKYKEQQKEKGQGGWQSRTPVPALLRQDVKTEIFALIGLAYLFLAWLLNEFLLGDEMRQAGHAGAEWTAEALERVEAFQQKARWIAYALIPLAILIKHLTISSFISTALLFSGRRTGFGRVFQISMCCESVFLLESLVRIVLISTGEGCDLMANQTGSLSLAAIIPPGEQHPWMFHPLRLLSLYQLGYLVLFSCLLDWVEKRSALASLGLIAMGYSCYLMIMGVFSMAIQISAHV